MSRAVRLLPPHLLGVCSFLETLMFPRLLRDTPGVWLCLVGEMSPRFRNSEPRMHLSPNGRCEGADADGGAEPAAAQRAPRRASRAAPGSLVASRRHASRVDPRGHGGIRRLARRPLAGA